MDDLARNIRPTGVKPGLVDPFGRHITYLRLSVTDRCDFRCRYCMAESMTFLPKREILTLEEMERLCLAFINKGVRKIRLTGGEPLVRKNILSLIRNLGRHISPGRFDELTLTTNASRLEEFASSIYASGVRRVNVSLDSLDPDRFRHITRRGNLATVLAGIKAGLKAGLHIKINTVALKGLNDDEIDNLIEWCGDNGMDLTLIETMPMGDIEGDRTDHYLPLSVVRERLQDRWTLRESGYRTGGPARYVTVAETGGRLGFITPLTHNFCEGCNRVRVTCTGMMYMCLGQEDKADLCEPLRADPSNQRLAATIEDAISRKPRGHDFSIERYGQPSAIGRHMSVTGG